MRRVRVTKRRIYSKDRSRRRTSGITKKGDRTAENHRETKTMQKKGANSPQLQSQLGGTRKEAKATTAR
jgi:hypothetical protein